HAPYGRPSPPFGGRKRIAMTTTRAWSQKEPRRRLGRHLALIALIATLGVLAPAAAGVAPSAGAVSTGDCINGRIIVKVQGKSITARCGTRSGPGRHLAGV